MSDYQHLVDAFFDAGGTVTECPERTYSVDQSIPVTPRQAAKQLCRAKARQRKFSVAGEMARRTESVRALAAEHLSAPEIAARLGLTASQVHHVAQSRRIRITSPAARRRAQYVELFEAGKGYAQIAETLGATRTAVRTMAVTLGYSRRG